MTKFPERALKSEEVQKYYMLLPMLQSLLTEMKDLSKKKPDGALNPLKVRVINKVLKQVKDLVSTDPVGEFLELLDEEVFPSNSDTALILAQHKAAMDRFRSTYHRRWSSNTYADDEWWTEEAAEKYTEPPEDYEDEEDEESEDEEDDAEDEDGDSDDEDE